MCDHDEHCRQFSILSFFHFPHQTVKIYAWLKNENNNRILIGELLCNAIPQLFIFSYPSHPRMHIKGF